MRKLSNYGVKSVRHSGAMGDLIYALWTVMKLGGCEKFYVSTRHSWGMDMLPLFPFIEPLLSAQPYIGSVELDMFCGYDVEVDLDVFRLASGKLKHTTDLVVDTVNKFYKLNLPSFDGSQWLFNIPTVATTQEFVCVHRTKRCRHNLFDYNLYVGNQRVTFIGLADEYEDFVRCYPSIHTSYYLTSDARQFASVIQASKFFVGNQSIGSAIAQGLAHPQIQETDPSTMSAVPLVRVEGHPEIHNITEHTYDYIVPSFSAGG